MTFSGHRARHRFGQHWLIDAAVLDQIVAAAALQPHDRVLEVGPGRGALTERLLACELAALEAVSNAQAQVLAAADALRRTPVSHEAVADLGKADAVLAAVLVRLVALVEQQPALQADPQVTEPLRTLRELPPRLTFARQMFNEAGAAYNAATTQFPTRLLGSLMRFGQAGRL